MNILMIRTVIRLQDNVICSPILSTPVRNKANVLPYSSEGIKEESTHIQNNHTACFNRISIADAGRHRRYLEKVKKEWNSA